MPENASPAPGGESFGDPERPVPLWRLWFGVRDAVPRRAYLLSGVGLMLFKYAVEAGVIGYYAGHWLTPWDFVNPLLQSRAALLQGAPSWLGWVLFAWNLPFVWIAFSMSVRRAADAGLSPWTGMLVLVPLLNLLVMLWLAGLPGDRTGRWTPAAETVYYGSPAPYRQALRALGAGIALGLVMLGLSVYTLDLYGATLFFGTPLLMGACTGFVYNRPHAQSWGATLGVACWLILAAGGILLLFALEGLICLVMAVPLVLPLGLIGAVLGKAIADSTATGARHMLPLVLTLPALAGAETLYHPAPESVVLTSVEIVAPPDVVWRHVVAFPDLSPPDDWFFRCGIACPLRARIVGRGVGAVRHCEFTTGDFVEPITAWDEPRRLAFDVTEQPAPMAELSPYRHVHPPHMQHPTLRSHRGEFRLVPLPGGRTRLEGRTWYTFEMFPQGYWTLWSDLSIHRIHRRVLDHIRHLSETDAGQPPDARG